MLNNFLNCIYRITISHHEHSRSVDYTRFGFDRLVLLPIQHIFILNLKAISAYGCIICVN